MKLRIVFLLLALVAAVALLAWRQGWIFSPEESREAQAAAAGAGPVGTVGEFKDPILDEMEAYDAELLKLLQRGEFAALEKRAEEARQGKLEFGNGTRKLSEFYDALGDCKKGAVGEWDNRMKELEEWFSATPTSMTAHVALANFFTSYAWEARGNGYADTVTEEGWRLFRDRLTKAEVILKRAKTFPARDSQYWRVYQRVALGQSWSAPEHEKLLEEGLAVDPTDMALYIGHAYHLLPRWGGGPGEVEAFVERASKMPGSPGPEVYARLALFFDFYHDHLFRDTKLKWALAKEGFEAWRRRCPNSIGILSNYAILGTRGNDPATVRRLFKELGNRLDVRTWKKQERYLYYRRYVD